MTGLCPSFTCVRRRGASDRVRVQRVNERTGEQVAGDEIVKGREIDGEIVVVEPDELREIAPGRSQTIDVLEFVDLAEIDPVYFDRTYWVAPSNAKYTHPYGLLCRALASSERASIATMTMHGREHLTALRADSDVLALQTLFWADEVRDPGEGLDVVPVQEQPRRVARSSDRRDGHRRSRSGEPARQRPEQS